jgi:hypothetical protein
VLRNLERYPAPDPRRLTYLILTHGFDIELRDEELFAMVRDRLGKAAADLGTRLLPLATNARAAVTGLPWDYAHGAAMAGVGLALAPLLHTCFIAGSNSIRTCQFWGTHPGLDPLWSTETLEFVSDGPMLGKIVKIPVIARSPVARRVLRVCWQNPGGVYNCARCEKCLRTMVILAVCGELGRVETLPAALDPDALAQLHIEPIYMGLWGALGRSLAAGGHGPDLVAAVERALTRTRRRRSRLGRAELSLLDTLARALRRVTGRR